MKTQGALLGSQEKRHMWEFQNGIRVNSQARVQVEINLHKQTKKAINRSWTQNVTQMNHEQGKFTRHTMTQTWRGTTTSFTILYYMTNGRVYIKMAKFLKMPRR